MFNPVARLFITPTIAQSSKTVVDPMDNTIIPLRTPVDVPVTFTTMPGQIPRDAVRAVVAFDPGWKNLGVWKGYIDSAGQVHTLEWDKLDITNKNKKPGGVYAQLCDALDRAPHLWQKFANIPYTVVIESQQPRNVPARIIASTLYGYFRASKLTVKFSGAFSKAQAKKAIAAEIDVIFDQAECTGTGTSSRAYKKTKTTSYDIVARRMGSCGGLFEREVVHKFRDKRGPFKGDDIAEAFLLGYAELKIPTKRGSRKAGMIEAESDEDAASSDMEIEIGLDSDDPDYIAPMAPTRRKRTVKPRVSAGTRTASSTAPPFRFKI
jgi:hypothetical protein